MITITQHEKNEWSRMAQTAYREGHNAVGHRYSAAASIPAGCMMLPHHFDALQYHYRQWLIANVYPVAV